MIKYRNSRSLSEALERLMPEEIRRNPLWVSLGTSANLLVPVDKYYEARSLVLRHGYNCSEPEDFGPIEDDTTGEVLIEEGIYSLIAVSPMQYSIQDMRTTEERKAWLKDPVAFEEHLALGEPWMNPAAHDVVEAALSDGYYNSDGDVRKVGSRTAVYNAVHPSKVAQFEFDLLMAYGLEDNQKAVHVLDTITHLETADGAYPAHEILGSFDYCMLIIFPE